MPTPRPTNGRVALQLLISALCGYVTPLILSRLEWRVGEFTQLPTAILLIALGFILVPVSPKSWWVSAVGALAGLYFGAVATGSKFGLFYVIVFAPWAFAGGFLGREVLFWRSAE